MDGGCHHLIEDDLLNVSNNNTTDNAHYHRSRPIYVEKSLEKLFETCPHKHGFPLDQEANRQ
jgi:hypothetical protein